MTIENRSNSNLSRSPAVARGVEFIRTNIRQGKFARGTRLPSEHELADESGLSRGTIRRAIEQLIDSGDLKRKPSSRPVVTGRSVQESRTVAQEIHVWITQPIANPVSLQFLQGVSAGLMGTRFRTVVREPIRFLKDAIREEERDFLRNLLESPRAAGAIIERDPFASNDDLFKQVLAEGKHLVFVDIPAPEGIDADHVGTNNTSASRRAATTLISQGHQKIWYVTDSDVALSSAARIEGYKRAMAQAGLGDEVKVLIATNLPESPSHSLNAAGIFLAHLNGSSNFADLGRRVVRTILESDEYPTAIMVNCDALALSILAYMEGAGIKVPEEISVIGFDWIARFGDPKFDVLTSISQDFEGFGSNAADLLLDRLNTKRTLSPRHVLLDAPLVTRQSTINRSASLVSA